MLYEYNYQKNRGSTAGIREIAPTLNWAFQDTNCILRYVVNNTVLDDQHPLRCMMRFVNNMLWFRSLDENRYIGFKSKSNDYYDFMFEEATLREFETFLHASGIENGSPVKTVTTAMRNLRQRTKSAVR